tara:strand:+ start:1309 stop:1977 length:669 start_codon:yes stop_codon:yes gene_type:complete
MSNYFNLLPNFDYVSRLPDAKISDYAKVKNLFKRVTLREDIYSNLMFFTKYSIKGDDRPDNVANNIYSDPTLDWLVLLANNITHIPTEWPMAQNDFDRFLLDKYDNYDSLENGVHHHETVEVKDSNDVTMVPAGLEVSSDFTTTYYDYFISGMVTKLDITRPVTNYEYEEKIENKKRNIYILKQEYVSVVMDDIEELMAYKKGSTEYVDKTLKKAENIRLYQ